SRAKARGKIALEEAQQRAEKLARARKLTRRERKRLKEERKRKEALREPVEKLLEKHTLTLDECIDVAMKTHIQLKVAKKQLKLARFRLLEARRNLGPTIMAKWEESGGKVNDKAYDGTKILFEGKQPIFYGGELVFSVGQAKVNLEIVESDYDRVRNDLVLQVKKAYYTLDKAKKALGIQKKLQSRAKTLFDMVKAGYEVAVIPQVEFLRISSQYNQTSFQVISAREDISVARLLLQHAMNIEEEIEIVGVKEPNIIKLDLEDCFNLASLNRPEIKISQLSLEYFKYEKKIMLARANWPRVDFLGSYGNVKEDYVNEELGGNTARELGPEYYFGTKISLPLWGSTLGYSYTEEDWQPVVQTTKGTEARTHTMTFSLFDKLGDISGVKEADIEYMRSLDEINKKKQEITLEVKEMFFKYRKAILLMDVAKSKVEFQAKQVEILEIKRELGEALYSDVVEEMIKLAEEEFSYIQAISDYYISIASLNKAIGIDGYFKI
ncbi:MAG: TolC family protein, partial [Candidatus Omnitrophota bacterium]